MLKVLTCFKRREGMTHEEFRDYYENHHAPFGVNFLLPDVRYYVRRYVKPMVHPITGATAAGFDYDVVMEMWFDDRAGFERTMARLSQPEIAAQLTQDEERLFDRSRMQSVILDEVETQLLQN